LLGLHCGCSGGGVASRHRLDEVPLLLRRLLRGWCRKRHVVVMVMVVLVVVKVSSKAGRR
jgi:hypothetical protein